MNEKGSEDRVVVLVDMDCFYCQVEEKSDPKIKGKPIAVVQYNQWKGGGIIAVNYVARAKGVTRYMRGDEAKDMCPDIELPRVPCIRGKADISKYRNAGKEVALVLQSFTPLLERASVDEAYLDITELVKQRKEKYNQYNEQILKSLPNTFAVGYDDIKDFVDQIYSCNETEQDLYDFNRDRALHMLLGGIITSEIRAAVLSKTGYECSAGIAHNKILAKLVCGLNKPNKQTILPHNSIYQFFETIPLTKIKSLGGKFGNSVCKILKVEKMNDLLKYTEKELQKHFDDKNGTFLYNIARGVDNEPVTPRLTSKSIGCCKRFPGKTAIADLNTLKHWLSELGDEIEERIKLDAEENNRYATQIVVSFTKLSDGKDVPCSRSLNMNTLSITGPIIAENSLEIIKKESKAFLSTDSDAKEDNPKLANSIKFLGITVGKFEENDKKHKNIKFFFKKSCSSTDAGTSSAACNKVETAGEDETTKSEPSSFFSSYMKKNDKAPEDPPESGTKETDSASDKETENVNDDKKTESASDDSRDSTDLEIEKSLCGENLDQPNEQSRNLSHDIFKENTKRCEKCHLDVAIEDLAEHRDYHFAQELEEKLRKETPSKVKIKSKRKDIGDFFATKSGETRQCDECKIEIPVKEFEEHLNFEAARRIHRELNRTERDAAKRKSEPPAAPVPKKSKCDTKPISSFFQKTT